MNAFGRGLMGCLGFGVGGVLFLMLLSSLKPTVTLTPTLLTPSPTAAGAAVAASSSPAAHIGTILDAGNWRYSVRQVDTAAELDVSTSQYFKSILKPKGLWVIVLMQITNIGDRNFSINSHDFAIRDNKGITYDPSSSTYQLVQFRQQTQLGEQMPPGVLLTTTLLFDVAPGTNGMVLWLEQAKTGIRLE